MRFEREDLYMFLISSVVMGLISGAKVRENTFRQLKRDFNRESAAQLRISFDTRQSQTANTRSVTPSDHNSSNSPAI